MIYCIEVYASVSMYFYSVEEEISMKERIRNINQSRCEDSRRSLRENLKNLGNWYSKKIYIEIFETELKISRNLSKIVIFEWRTSRKIPSNEEREDVKTKIDKK